MFSKQMLIYLSLFIVVNCTYAAFLNQTEITLSDSMKEFTWYFSSDDNNSSLDLSQLYNNIFNQFQEEKAPEFESIAPLTPECEKIRKNFNYCKLGENHTVCQYPSCDFQGGCRQVAQRLLTDDERHEILDAHNRLRSQVALGERDQPAATDMNQLIWDNELEMIAQCWVNQGMDLHDVNRAVRSGQVGQNIWDLWSTSWSIVNNTNLSDAVEGWYNETYDMPPGFSNESYTSLVDSFYVYDKLVGHFTQLAWAKTSRVGCGRAYLSVDGWYYQRLVCNYGPTGNILGMPIYTTGNQPASQCENGRNVSKTFIGLCA